MVRNVGRSLGTLSERVGSSERKTNQNGVSVFFWTLFTGIHLKRAPRAAILKKNRGYVPDLDTDEEMSYPRKIIISLGKILAKTSPSSLLKTPPRLQHIIIDVFVWLDHQVIMRWREIKYPTLPLQFRSHCDLLVLNMVIASRFRRFLRICKGIANAWYTYVMRAVS